MRGNLMSFTTKEFKQWLEIQGELNQVNSGFVVGFDYDWHLSIDTVDKVESGEIIQEYGSYYKSEIKVEDNNIFVDIRQSSPGSEITKVFFIIEKNKENFIKEVNKEKVENHMIDDTTYFEELIYELFSEEFKIQKTGESKLKF